MQLIHQDQSIFKQPPHSIESEQAVLGGMALKNDAYWEVNGIVQAKDFFLSQHRIIFSAIASLSENDKPTDIITLSELLERNGDLEKAGGLLYLGKLCKDIPSAANIKAYADIVAERSMMRQAIITMEAAVSALYTTKDDPEEVISIAQAGLESIAIGKNGETTTFAEVLRQSVDLITANRELRLMGKLPGISYGVKALDDRTGGMRKGQLILIAGRPSLGKTAFSHQVALLAAQDGHPIGELSLEMSKPQLGIRSFANKFRVNNTRLLFGHDDEMQQTNDGLTESPGFKDIPLYIDDATYEYHSIVSRIVEWKRKFNIEAVIIDHLGLVNLSAYQNKVDRLGYITNNLKRLAKRLDIAIVIIGQLNRANEKEKRHPTLSDTRDCGEIEQDIDVGIFLHSQGDEEAREVEVEIGLLKNRDGMRGWLPDDVRFVFRKAIQVFEQLSSGPNQYAEKRG